MIFEQLWDIIGQHQQKIAKWNEGKFNLIDPKEVQNSIAEWSGNLSKLQKQFQKEAKSGSGTEDTESGQKDYTSCCLDAQQMAQDLQADIDNFS